MSLVICAVTGVFFGRVVLLAMVRSGSGRRTPKPMGITSQFLTVVSLDAFLPERVVAKQAR